MALTRAVPLSTYLSWFTCSAPWHPTIWRYRSQITICLILAFCFHQNQILHYCMYNCYSGCPIDYLSNTSKELPTYALVIWIIQALFKWVEFNFHKLACIITNLDLSIKFRPHWLSISDKCMIGSLNRMNRRDGDRSYGLVFLMIFLGFILFIMLMVPSIIQPPVLYIGVIFSLLSIIFIIAFMNSYIKQKSSHPTADRDDDTDRQLSGESHPFTDTIALDVCDGQTYCESQVSMTSSDLPPKYEPPPSYSQTIYSINIWLKRIAKRWWLGWHDASGGQDCHSAPQSTTNVFTQTVVYMTYILYV